MRVPSRVEPAQPLTFMWERHREIARRLVAGDRQIDIARSMGMTEGRLSIIVNSPLFMLYLQELSAKADDQAADIQGRLSKLAVSSMTVLENAIHGTGDMKEGVSPGLKTRIAQDVLDRAGYGAVQKTASLTAVLTAEDIEKLKKRRNRETFTGTIVIDQEPQSGA